VPLAIPPVVLRALLALALVAYAAAALVTGGWLTATAAALVALLLWRAHRRARFSAYVFLSVVAARGLVTGAWAAVGFAAGAILLLQAPAARRVWPRLHPSTWRRPML
jgi:hypothetical protein